MATLCQIAGRSLALQLPSTVRKRSVAGLIASGKVTMLGDWIIRSQVLKLARATDAVQRLDDSGFSRTTELKV